MDFEQGFLDGLGPAQVGLGPPFGGLHRLRLNFHTCGSRYAPSQEPARILLKAGADVNHQSNSGDTALIYATRNGQFETTRVLLEAGADVDLKNAKGETALSLAKSLQSGGPRPMRPDRSPEDFVKLLQGARKP
jgi:hypothetical protein